MTPILNKTCVNLDTTLACPLWRNRLSAKAEFYVSLVFYIGPSLTPVPRITSDCAQNVDVSSWPRTDDMLARFFAARTDAG